MAKGLRPLTNVYAFFGSTDVGVGTRPATSLLLGGIDGAFEVGETLIDTANNHCTVLMTTDVVDNVATVLISNVSGNVSSTTASPYGAANGMTIGLREIMEDDIGDVTHVFATGNTITGATSAATASITLASKYSLGAANGIMRTDKNGQMAGEVFINDGVFRTGDNLLRITDSSLDNVAATVAVAETKWSAKGVLDSHSAEYVSTREAIIRRETANEEKLFTDTTCSRNRKNELVKSRSTNIFCRSTEFSKRNIHKKR